MLSVKKENPAHAASRSLNARRREHHTSALSPNSVTTGDTSGTLRPGSPSAMLHQRLPDVHLDLGFLESPKEKAEVVEDVSLGDVTGPIASAYVFHSSAPPTKYAILPLFRICGHICFMIYSW